MPYTSPLPFEPHRIHAAAVYCSDGRFGDQCDDFLHQHLSLPNYDRFAVPGGPGALVGHPNARLPREAALEDLRLLIEAHQLTRMVLIAHEQCAFYKARLGLDDEQIEPQQRHDLQQAASLLASQHPGLNIACYLARPVQQQGVHFEPVDHVSDV